MTKPELYIAVFRHEYGVDCFTFYFVPNDNLKHPSPRNVAEHFNIDFEPEKGETFELVPAFGPQIETLAAEQIGRKTVASADWWDESQEGWGDKDTDEDDTESNVPCVACGRKDLPLHIDGRCGACGPSPTTDGQETAGTEIRLPCYGITICLDRTNTEGLVGGTITSDLKLDTTDDSDDTDYVAGIDGLESLILAHACAGVDVTSPDYIEGVETAVEAIGNHHG
jgi:hypothetical protein